MPDAATLSAASLGAVALTEGIKFLYGQAGELLKRWRERKDKADKDEQPVEPVDVSLPGVFEGRLLNPAVHYDALQQAAPELLTLYKELTVFADDLEPVDSQDPALLARVDVLRSLIEAVYQQRITFKGEDRPASGPEINVKIKVEEVLGYASVMRVRNFRGGRAKAEGEFGKVGPGAEAVGFEADTVGE